MSNRRSVVLPAPAVESLADAADAASRLRAAWAALVSGRFDGTAWSAVLADAEALLALAQNVRDARR